jgi:ectoine hydroxylase
LRRDRGIAYRSLDAQRVDGKEVAMTLTEEQLQRFEREGYLFFPGLFSPAEVKALTDEVPALYAQRRPENVREKGSDAVRTNFAAHMYSRPFARLARHPRMVEPVVQLFGEDVYMHQFKINGKAAFDGDVWQWHQDYGTWANDDRMPEARAMNVAIFLDEVNEFNGPLMFIPGSHRQGVLDARHDTSTTSYPLWTIDDEAIRALVAQGGLVAPKGPAGSMILFHGCLVHASGSNLSPWNRVSVYLSLCAVSNHIRRFKRPGYIAHRDFTPIRCLPDDCLLKDYDVPLPWKDGTPAEELQGVREAA